MVATKPTIAIQSTSPAGETPLIAGEQVTFKLAARANNTTEGSSFGLIAQTADGVSLAIGGPEPIKKGSTEELVVSATIPQTTSVEVFVALYANPNEDSIAVDSRTYRVVGALSK